MIGGLVPDSLVQRAEVAHQGTTDVDVALSVGFVYDRDEQSFAWLESGLRTAGFVPDERTGAGWRWIATVRGVAVRLELLCDVEGEVPGVIGLPGCVVAGAANLHGPGAAIEGSRTVSLRVPDELGGGNTDVRFASLSGYVVAKAAAIASRGLDKDLYDFAYVLIHNAEGGARQAAAALLARPDAAEILLRYGPEIRAAVELFTEGSRTAARTYAEEMVMAGSGTAVDVLVEDATSAALEFWTQLDVDRRDRQP